MEIVNHIKYDLAKRGVPPVIDAVQGEENSRIIELSIFANGSTFDVSGSVCSLVFKKPDGTSGWYDTMPDGSEAYTVNGYAISMKIAPQVLTVPGDVMAVIRIEMKDGSGRTTTFPFSINVSEDPAINAPKSENYYSVQTWADVNEKFKAIEDILDDSIIDDTKISFETAWSSKNTVDKLCPSFTESDGVVACNPVEGYPLSIVSHIEPVQAGTGDPSPDNVRAISGFEQIKVWQGGKNLVDPALYIQSSGNTTLDGDVFTTNFISGGLYVNRYSSAKGIHPAGTYTVSVIPVSSYVSLSIFVYDHATDKEIKRLLNTGEQNGYTLTFTADAPFKISIAGSTEGANYGTYSYKLQLEVGTTATEYEPYRGDEITFDLGQTVYGGNLDWNTGLLTVTHEYIQLTSSIPVIALYSTGGTNGVQFREVLSQSVGHDEGICSHAPVRTDWATVYTLWLGSNGNSTIYWLDILTQLGISTLDEFNAWLDTQNVQVCHKLPTPVTVQLTPQEILALAGTNSIYSNTGNTDVSGKADPNAVIQDLYNKLNALSATMTALTGV